MAQELGIGVRVWVGYTDQVDERVAHARCNTGRITDGPFPPGETKHGRVNMTQYPLWAVTMVDGSYLAVAEHLLYPIDDDGGLSVNQEQSQETTT